MPKVHKTIAEARKHLGEAVSVIPARYIAATAKADWEGPATTDQAEANYVAGLAESQAADRRRSRMREAGNAKYKIGCEKKGGVVIGSRITAALADYEREMAPILSAMVSAADAAPPRGRDAMANIDARLKPVVQAAIAAKRR